MHWIWKKHTILEHRQIGSSVLRPNRLVSDPKGTDEHDRTIRDAMEYMRSGALVPAEDNRDHDAVRRDAPEQPRAWNCMDVGVLE